jgi:hypothetical protein
VEAERRESESKVEGERVESFEELNADKKKKRRSTCIQSRSAVDSGGGVNTRAPGLVALGD